MGTALSYNQQENRDLGPTTSGNCILPTTQMDRKQILLQKAETPERNAPADTRISALVRAPPARLLTYRAVRPSICAVSLWYSVTSATEKKYGNQNASLSSSLNILLCTVASQSETLFSISSLLLKYNLEVIFL